MKENSSTDKSVVVSSIIFAVLFIGLFLTPVRVEIRTGISLFVLYVILLITTFFLLIKNLLSRKKITRKWIKYFAFLPICVAIVPPLFLIVLAAFEPSLDKQCHKLICELKSSELLKNGWIESNTSGVPSKGPIFFKPRREGDSYIYDISRIIYKQKKRELKIEADNCNASFSLDIPEMPKSQPFSKWNAPVKIRTGKNKKIKLELRYKVIKSKFLRSSCQKLKD